MNYTAHHRRVRPCPTSSNEPVIYARIRPTRRIGMLRLWAATAGRRRAATATRPRPREPPATTRGRTLRRAFPPAVAIAAWTRRSCVLRPTRAPQGSFPSSAPMRASTAPSPAPSPRPPRMRSRTGAARAAARCRPNRWGRARPLFPSASLSPASPASPAPGPWPSRWAQPSSPAPTRWRTICRTCSTSWSWAACSSRRFCRCTSR